MRSVIALGAIATAGVLAFAGCSSSGSDSAGSGSTSGTSSAPTSQPTATVKDVKDIKMAFFTATGNDYLAKGISALQAYAKQEGFSVDVFDGKFDPQTQFNQMQTALTSGKYNAWVVEATDGNLVCNIASKDAPAKGVMVAVMNTPLCGNDTKLGEATWTPGTVTYVGGQTLDVYKQWVAKVKDDFPDGAKIALIEGPQLGANSKNFDAAANEAFTGSYKVVARQYTDYTTAKAFSAAQTIIQAHPDVNVIMSNYAGMSQGVVQATTGKDIAVYDFGGNKWALSQVQSGALKSTIMMLPGEESVDSAKAIVSLVQGTVPQKFVNLTEEAALGGKSAFVYKDTVSQYTAEY